MSRLITITDIHDTDGQIEKSEMQTVAEIEGSENDYSIYYDEQSEEMKNCRTRVHVTNGDCVQISRTGSYNTELKMQKGRRHQCCYATPVGQITMGVIASRIISEFSEEQIKLDFTYTLDFNNELISKNRVKILVSGKEAD